MMRDALEIIDALEANALTVFAVYRQKVRDGLPLAQFTRFTEVAERFAAYGKPEPLVIQDRALPPAPPPGKA